MLYINPSTCTPYIIHRARTRIADGSNTTNDCQHIHSCSHAQQALRAKRRGKNIPNDDVNDKDFTTYICIAVLFYHKLYV